VVAVKGRLDIKLSAASVGGSGLARGRDHLPSRRVVLEGLVMQTSCKELSEKTDPTPVGERKALGDGGSVSKEAASTSLIGNLVPGRLANTHAFLGGGGWDSTSSVMKVSRQSVEPRWLSSQLLQVIIMSRHGGD
jgi:hypothetical protein